MAKNTLRLSGTTLIETLMALALFVVIAGLWGPVAQVVPLWQDEDLLAVLDVDRTLSELAADGTVAVGFHEYELDSTAAIIKMANGGKTYRVELARRENGHSVLTVRGENDSGNMPMLSDVTQIGWKVLRDHMLTYHLVMSNRFFLKTKKSFAQYAFDGVVTTDAP